MNVWITGSRGMLAFALNNILSKKGYKVIGTDREVDITNKEQLESFATNHKIDLIINCAAYTDVDGAEGNVEKVFKINAAGPKNLAEMAKQLDVPLIHFSTDYVFDGQKKAPYKEEDKANPLQVYGRAKLAGELNIQKEWHKHYIIRTSWLFGPMGKNFVYTILNLCDRQESLKVVNDQVGRPTYTFDLAMAVEKLIEKQIPYGLYHIANNGHCSWYEFAQEIIRLAKRHCRIVPVPSDEYPRPAPRPKFSVLSIDKFQKMAGIVMPSWQQGLQKFISSYVLEQG